MKKTNYQLYRYKLKEYQKLCWEIISYLDLLLDNDLKPTEKAYQKFKDTFENLDKLKKDRE